ncbi:MAG: hypothetical protein ACTHKM_03865 [Tsuneonella sp.]
MHVTAWPDLVAKLATARDLRHVFARPRSDLASFAPQAARALAVRETDKGSVNPDALADRKGTEDITQAAAQPAGHGDRETR